MSTLETTVDELSLLVARPTYRSISAIFLMSRIIKPRAQWGQRILRIAVPIIIYYTFCENLIYLHAPLTHGLYFILVCCAHRYHSSIVLKNEVKNTTLNHQKHFIQGRKEFLTIFSDTKFWKLYIKNKNVLHTVIWQDWNKLRFESPKILNTFENVYCIVQ